MKRELTQPQSVFSYVMMSDAEDASVKLCGNDGSEGSYLTHTLAWAQATVLCNVPHYVHTPPHMNVPSETKEKKTLTCLVSQFLSCPNSQTKKTVLTTCRKLAICRMSNWYRSWQQSPSFIIPQQVWGHHKASICELVSFPHTQHRGTPKMQCIAWILGSGLQSSGWTFNKMDFP